MAFREISLRVNTSSCAYHGAGLFVKLPGGGVAIFPSAVLPRGTYTYIR